MEAAISSLLAFPQVERTDEGISLKPAVKEDTRRALDTTQIMEYLGHAITIVNASLPQDVYNMSSWQLSRRYHRHVFTAYSLALKYSIRSLKLAEMVANEFPYLTECLSYPTFRAMGALALLIRREQLGNDTFETTESMLQLGKHLVSWLYYREGEKLLLPAKEIRTALFGRYHKYTIEANLSLAELYLEWEHYTQLLLIWKDELDLGPDAISWDHDDRYMRYTYCRYRLVFTTMRIKTGTAPDVQPRLQECATEFKKTLQDYEVFFGLDHPFCVTVRCRLAYVFSMMPKETPQAIRLLEQCIRKLKGIVPPHNRIPGIYITLATLYEQTNQIQACKEALESAVTTSAKIFEEDKEIKFHALIQVLAKVKLAKHNGILSGQHNMQSAENQVVAALRDYDAWFSVFEEEFLDLSATSTSLPAQLITLGCTLRNGIAGMDMLRGQGLVAEANLKRVVHVIESSGFASVRKSGISATSRMHLVTLYSHARWVPQLRVYGAELAAQLAENTTFEHWWTVLGGSYQYLISAFGSMSQDPAGRQAMSRSLIGVVDVATKKDQDLRRSGLKSEESTARAIIISQLQAATFVSRIPFFR